MISIWQKSRLISFYHLKLAATPYITDVHTGPKLYEFAILPIEHSTHLLLLSDSVEITSISLQVNTEPASHPAITISSTTLICL